MIMQNFNYHQHTYRCGHADLDMLDEEYVTEYIKMDFKRIAFTDHCPEKNEIDTREDVRMKYSQREEYLANIKKLKEKLKNVIYPCKGFWEIASQYDIKVLYGMDIHHRGQILLWNELREFANQIIGEETLKKLNFIEDSTKGEERIWQY